MIHIFAVSKRKQSSNAKLVNLRYVINRSINIKIKQIEKTASATNFTAINLGKLNELGDYLLELAPEIKIPGKVFGGAALQATGSEFSFQLFQPGTETGFLHTHQTHEELYF